MEEIQRQQIRKQGAKPYSQDSATILDYPYLDKQISTEKFLNRNRIKEILHTTGGYIPYKFKGNYEHRRINTYRVLTIVKRIKTVDLAIVDLKVVPEKPLLGQEAENKVLLYKIKEMLRVNQQRYGCI